MIKYDFSLQWMCYNDTDSEIPMSNNAFPGENHTTAQMSACL